MESLGIGRLDLALRLLTTLFTLQSRDLRPPSALSRPMASGDKTINASTFGYMFSALVQQCQSRVTTISDLNRKCVLDFW